MLPMRTNTTGGTNRLAGPSAERSPFALIDEMRREVDRVFDQMVGSWNDPLTPRLGGSADSWLPTMDVQETDDALRPYPSPK
jgi:hypothetical protein